MIKQKRYLIFFDFVDLGSPSAIHRTSQALTEICTHRLLADAGTRCTATAHVESLQKMSSSSFDSIISCFRAVSTRAHVRWKAQERDFTRYLSSDALGVRPPEIKTRACLASGVVLPP